MILGILSDTHSLNLPPALIERFKKVDLIIHAGDICDVATLRFLKSLAPLKAVQGNMDDAAIKKQLLLKELFICEGKTIGLTHGHVGDVLDAMTNAQAMFNGEKVDVVIFGHSHKALSLQQGPTLYFNPGSPNDIVKAKFFSYGIIEVSQSRIKAEIIKI